jgi:N-acetylglutamate synthase-like GNAT family acetyltransferase
MRIRKATKKDARKISILRRKTLREINKNDYPEVFIQFLINENSTQGIINKMKDREMFCAWKGNTLLGTIDLAGNKIGGLFIKSSEIGKGLGVQLMDFIENYARSKKIKQVRLYSTKFAFNFYKKRGYHLMPSGYWVIGKSRSKDKVMIKKL